MPTESKRGSNGGSARAQKLTKEQRSAIAKDAAKKRWAAKKEGSDVDKLTVKLGDPLVLISGSKMQEAVIYEPVIPIPEPPKELHCSGCANGDGNHFAGTVEHPFNPVTQIVDTPPVLVEPTPPPVQQKPAKRTPKPMPKEFKSASSYAEKRLPLAIKEKSEHVGAVAKLDAEINDLVRVIKALGGTVDPQVAMQPYSAPYNPNAAFPPASQYPAPQFVLPADPGIDPALFQANMGPVPGMGGQMPQVPVIPNTSLGGAMDLDYTPRDEEDNKLPSMGGGWV